MRAKHKRRTRHTSIKLLVFYLWRKDRRKRARRWRSLTDRTTAIGAAVLLIHATTWLSEEIRNRRKGGHLTSGTSTDLCRVNGGRQPKEEEEEEKRVRVCLSLFPVWNSMEWTCWSLLLLLLLLLYHILTELMREDRSQFHFCVGCTGGRSS